MSHGITYQLKLYQEGFDIILTYLYVFCVCGRCLQVLHARLAVPHDGRRLGEPTRRAHRRHLVRRASPTGRAARVRGVRLEARRLRRRVDALRGDRRRRA